MVPHPPLIIPEVGGGQEKEIHRTVGAYEEAARRVAALRPETIVLLSPHQAMYGDYFHISPGKGAKGDFGRFQAAGVKLEAAYDREFVDQLCRLAAAKRLPAGTLGERDSRLDHGTMVPLYFVNRYWREYRLVRIGLSGLALIRHYELGQCIREAASSLNRRTVVIASGDLSHRLKEEGPYGYQEEGPEYDSRIMDVMGRGAFGELLDFSEEFCERAGECGHRSFVIMAGALDESLIRSERLSYEGPFGVGYGICCYSVEGDDSERNFGEQYEQSLRQQVLSGKGQEDAYVALARQTIEAYVGRGERLSLPQGLPREMYDSRAGVFVSVKEDGRLRGCIGTIQAVQASLSEEIIENAISAATSDPRFTPIEPWELDRLVISVDVLGEMEKIASQAELDPLRYGVVVTKGRKRGLLLPNLEGVDTAEEQVAIAKRKAGIGQWEQVELERFQVVRHEV